MKDKRSSYLRENSSTRTYTEKEVEIVSFLQEDSGRLTKKIRFIYRRKGCQTVKGVARRNSISHPYVSAPFINHTTDRQKSRVQHTEEGDSSKEVEDLREEQKNKTARSESSIDADSDESERKTRQRDNDGDVLFIVLDEDISTVDEEMEMTTRSRSGDYGGAAQDRRYGDGHGENSSS